MAAYLALLLSIRSTASGWQACLIARFLSDRTGNRYAVDERALEVSKIFDWYRKDFSKGYRGIVSLESYLAANAARLADGAADQDAIRSQKVRIRFLEYDWALNDRK